MSLNWRPVATIPNTNTFVDRLYAFIKPLEVKSSIELNNLHLVNGKLTIGVGFDLAAGGDVVRDRVFSELGLDYDYPENNAGAKPGTPEAIESDYIRRLRVAVQGSSAKAVNDIMAARAADTRLNGIKPSRRPSFSFNNNETEVKAVFDDLWNDYYQKNIFNKWPSLKNDTQFAESSEIMALASMTWNGGTGILGKKLKYAIDTGNRAEAWFEIRYGSNGDHQKADVKPGLAKRRFLEAQMFGLYDNPSAILLSEAEKIYTMMQTNRAKILQYEGDWYGRLPTGMTGQRTDGNGRLPIDAAVQDYNALLPYVQSGTIQTLEEALEPAKKILLADLIYKYPELALTGRLNDDQVKSPNIYLSSLGQANKKNEVVLDAEKYEKYSFLNDVMIGCDLRDLMWGGKGDDDLLGGGGNDALYGGEGSDVLYGDGDNDWLDGGDGNDFIYGGEGEDVIEGGLGNDTLYGGADDDTYRVKAGDGEQNNKGDGSIYRAISLPQCAKAL